MSTHRAHTVTQRLYTSVEHLGKITSIRVTRFAMASLLLISVNVRRRPLLFRQQLNLARIVCASTFPYARKMVLAFSTRAMLIVMVINFSIMESVRLKRQSAHTASVSMYPSAAAGVNFTIHAMRTVQDNTIMQMGHAPLTTPQQLPQQLLLNLKPSPQPQCRLQLLLLLSRSTTFRRESRAGGKDQISLCVMPHALEVWSVLRMGIISVTSAVLHSRVAHIPPTTSTVPTTTEMEGCNCIALMSPVCANGISYINPCFALCEGISSWVSGNCTVEPKEAVECPSDDSEQFDGGRPFRMQNTRRNTLGTRFFGSSVTACASHCVDWGQCSSFFPSFLSCCRISDNETLIQANRPFLMGFLS